MNIAIAIAPPITAVIAPYLAPRRAHVLLLSGTLGWNSDALYLNGVVSVIDTNFRPGDFDRDGHANVADVAAAESALADLIKYRSSHGNMTAAQLVSIGDLNGDTMVTNADLQGLIVLLANGGGGGLIAAVPEPASLVILALGALAIPGALLRRRRCVIAAPAA